MPADFVQATPVVRIPALVAGDVRLTDFHSIIDYLDGKVGNLRLLAKVPSFGAAFGTAPLDEGNRTCRYAAALDRLAVQLNGKRSPVLTRR